MGTIAAYAKTDTGRARRANQDFIFASCEPVGPLPNLFVLADGMGGHRAGDFASRYFVEEMVKYIQSQNGDDVVKVLETAVQDVNGRLYRLSGEKEELGGMGTTCVLAVAKDGTLHVGNVGDSRLYVLQGRLRQVTKDHSYVEELVALGRMSRDSEEYHRQKNIITRAIGTDDTVKIDFFEETLDEGAYFVLCSDGLSNMVGDEEIEGVALSEGTLEEKAEELVTKANQNGGYDNISVILGQVLPAEVKTC